MTTTRLYWRQQTTCGNCGEVLPERVALSNAHGARFTIEEPIMVAVRCAGVGCHTDHFYSEDARPERA